MRVEMHALFALIIVATLVGIIVATSQDALSDTISGWVLFAALGFASAFVYGFLPVVLYGAPAYALLSQLRRATLLSAAVIGIAPGVVVMAVAFAPSLQDSDVNLALGSILSASGLAVAALTHWLSKNAHSASNAL